MAGLAVGLQDREDVFVVGGPLHDGEDATYHHHQEPAATARDVLITSLLKSASGRPEGLHHFRVSIIPLRRNPVRFRLMAAAAVAALLAAALGAQKTADGDWPMYGRDLAGTKFSPLKQVTAENVSRLQPAWNLTLVERPAPVPGQGRGRGAGGPEIPSNPEVTPSS
jgi:hypothetical protein